jgi:hypothetical protein
MVFDHGISSNNLPLRFYYQTYITALLTYPYKTALLAD